MELAADITCIACSVFRNELEALRVRGDVGFPVHYLDSMLHLRPCELRRRLGQLLEDQLERGARVLLLYGDCHAYMNEQASKPGVCRVSGANCPEILLGRGDYRSLRAEGAFFLLPEWTTRWREVFHVELGLDEEAARNLVGDAHTKLLYLDTGFTPVPIEDLKAISDYAGLPWQTMRIGAEHLLRAIHEALERRACDES